MPLPDDVLERLREDDELYAKRCLKVVDESAETVPLVYRPAQKKLSAARALCRARGLPVRIIVLKSRKTGISTEVQGWALEDATLKKNRRVLTVAQDYDTASELHEIAETMYVHLPEQLDPRLKPALVEHKAARGGTKFMRFGEPAKALRVKGELGVNSSFSIDTAKEVHAGRGKTIFFLHCSEVAFWPDPAKATGLLNAVPDRPDTIVVIESTANGHNFFKSRWDRAERGEGGYVPVFIGWTEDPACWRAFPDPDARERFIEEIGKGEWGQDEPRLIERFGATPEQLYWRRFAIVDKADGKLAEFKQEYPSSPEEAFMGSGKHRFSMVYISRAVDRAERFDPRGGKPLAEPIDGVSVPPAIGVLQPSAYRTRKLARETLEVPSGSLFVPREATGFRDDHPFWRIWERTEQPEADEPKLPDPYIVIVDPAQGEENTLGESDYHGIQVLNHRTGEQAARYRSKVDPDQIAYEALLAGLYFNEALIVVEITGGHGTAILKTWLWKRYGYRRLYERQRIEGKEEKTENKLGWSTDRRTKPHIEDGFAELLREETHGIRDRQTALELTTYVKDDRGRTGSEPEAYDDLIVPYMIGQEIRRLVPMRPLKPAGTRENRSSLTRTLPQQWR